MEDDPTSGSGMAKEVRRPEGMPDITGITDLALEISRDKQWIWSTVQASPGAITEVARVAAGPVYIKPDLRTFILDPEHNPVEPSAEWDPAWELVARYEISVMMGGVSRSRAGTKMQHEKAPHPVADLRMGLLWLRPEVSEFLKVRLRSGRPPFVVDIDQARTLYEGSPEHGLTLVAATLGVPRSVVFDRLTAAGVQLRPADQRKPRRKVENAERSLILAELAKPGANYSAVGTLFDRSPMTVQRIKEDAARKAGDQ
jgi:hypothetical protein